MVRLFFRSRIHSATVEDRFRRNDPSCAFLPENGILIRAAAITAAASASFRLMIFIGLFFKLVPSVPGPFVLEFPVVPPPNQIKRVWRVMKPEENAKQQFRVVNDELKCLDN